MLALKSYKILMTIFNPSLDLATNEANHDEAVALLTREECSFRVVSRVYWGNVVPSILFETASDLKHYMHLQSAMNLGLMFERDDFIEVAPNGLVTYHNMKAQYRTDVYGYLAEMSPDVSEYRDPITGKGFSIIMEEWEAA